MSQVVYVAFYFDDDVDEPVLALLGALQTMQPDPECGLEQSIVSNIPFTQEMVDSYEIEETPENEMDNRYRIPRQGTQPD